MEYEEDYKGEMERYRTLLATWKEQNKLKVGLQDQAASPNLGFDLGFSCDRLFSLLHKVTGKKVQL